MKDYYLPINHTTVCYCKAQPPKREKLPGKCLEDYTALFFEPYSSSVLLHPQNIPLSRFESLLLLGGCCLILQGCSYQPYYNGRFLKQRLPENTMGSKALWEEAVSSMHYSCNVSVYKLLSHGASIQPSLTLGRMGSFSTGFPDQKTEAE